MKEFLNRAQAFSEVWWAGGCRDGKTLDSVALEPGYEPEAEQALRHLRDLFGILRMHRLPVRRLHWKLDRGALLAVHGEGGLRCLVCGRAQNNWDPLWALLEERA